MLPVLAAAIGFLWFIYVAGPDTWTAALRAGTDAASSPDLQIEAGQFSRRDDGVLVLERLSLADGEGVWLTVEDVALDIDTGALLGREAVIEGVVARRIEVLRAPASAEPEPEPDTELALPDRLELPELPLGVRLRSLKVEELVLAEGLAPERTRLGIEASADYTGAEKQVRLNVSPLDLDRSHLNVLASADAAANRLDVDISGDLPVIAPLDEALGTPEGARLLVEIKGGGPLDNAALELTLNIDGVADLAGDIMVANAADRGLSLRIDALANLTGGAVAEPAALIGNPVAVEGVFQLPSSEVLTIEKLHVGAPWLDASVSGGVELAEQALDLRTRVTLRHHEGFDAYLSGASFRQLVLQGSVKGPMDRLAADLSAQAEAPVFAPYSAGSAEIGITGVTDLASFEGDLTATLANPRTGDEGTQALVGETAELKAHVSADPERAEVTGIRLVSAFAQASGQVTARLAAPELDGQLNVTVPNLAAAPQIAPQLNSGRASIDVSFNGLSPEGGSSKLALNLSELDWKEAQMQSVVGSSFSLEGTAGLSAGGQQTADIAIRSGGGINGDLKMVTDGEAIDGSYDFTMSAIPPGLAPPALAGLRNIRLSGDVAGTVEDPRTKGRLQAATLDLNGIEIGSPVIAFDASELTGSPLVRIDGSANVLGAPAKFGTAVRADLENQRITLADTSAGYRSASIGGQARVNLASTAVDSRLTIRAADLADFKALAGVDLGGEIDATVDLKPRGKTMDLIVRLTGKGIRAETATVGDIRGDITLSDLLGNAPALGGDITVTDIAADGAAVERVDIALAGDINNPGATIAAKVTKPEPVSVRTQLSADLSDPEALGIRFASLQLDAEPGSITARSPFLILLRGENVEARGLDLAASFGGVVAGDAVYGPQRVEADLAIKTLPLGPLAKIAGVEGVTGEANATARLDTAASGDKGGVSLKISGLTLPDLPSDTPFTILVDGAWRRGQALVDARIEGPFGEPLTAKIAGDLPFPRGSALPEVPMNGDVTGEIRWAGDMARLIALMPSSDHVVNGQARIDVALDGTWAKPRLSGDALIGPARYENLTSGSVLEQLTANIAFDDTGTGRFSLSGQGPDGGTVSGRGDLVLLGENQNADIQISTNRLLAFRRDEARAVISGDTKIGWDGTSVDVFVRQTINEAVVYLAAPNLPPNVIAIELERDKKPEEEKAPPPDLPVNLDVEVTSPGQFFVRGRGLESEWRGDVSVKGRIADPQIRSNFQAVRGSLSLLGRTFELTEGQLDLDESLNPTFRIELERETPDLTGSIIVSGNPQQPDISFASTPELPPDEVLPRLLFDKSKQSLSPLEAVNLAQGINTLTNGKPGTTDRIRDAVGLDVLRFEEADDPESAGAVSVGRYVRDGVYVGAKKSVDNEAGSVVVEIDVLPNVKVDTEVGQDGGTSTGITWEYKY
ncbi:MAG: translocation/assembly module TamB domain-containing protein [Minwuia sp.]|uniref:translocation/assembly module TamB domain-containing protein n=1 Tax=Minwuia sp. TaxID=2493630 RepID=UPI003A8A9427